MANPTQRERSGFNNPGTTAAETAHEMAGAARATAAAVAEKAGEAATYLGNKAEGATAAVGSGMRSLAGTIRENLPHEGALGSASGAVASTLESGGRYLEHEGLKGIGNDVTNVIRRNPIPAVLIGIGIGFLIARAARS